LRSEFIPSFEQEKKERIDETRYFIQICMNAN